MLKNLIFYYLILLELVILLEQLDVRCNFTFVVSCAPHLKQSR